MSDSPADNPGLLDFNAEEMLALRELARDSRMRPSRPRPLPAPKEEVETGPSIGLASQD